MKLNWPRILKDVREDLGLSQVGMAEVLGSTRSQVALIEQGRRSPTVEFLEKWLKMGHVQLALRSTAIKCVECGLGLSASQGQHRLLYATNKAMTCEECGGLIHPRGDM